jgi:haloalkane dehalogenase
VNTFPAQKTSNSRRSFMLTALAGLAVPATNASAQTPAPAMNPSGPLDFKEHFIERGGGRLYAREWNGSGPTFVLLHGFPDNLHIYDELAPLLAAAGKHVVSFDFLGFGSSDKPTNLALNFPQQVADVEAVVRALGHDKVIPVGHDSGGPAAINFAVSNPDRVASVTLLNTLYTDSPSLVMPEIIQLFADPVLHAMAMDILTDPGRAKWLLDFQNQRFLVGANDLQKEIFRTKTRPIFDGNFANGAAPAFVQMTGDLRRAMAYNSTRLEQVRRFAPQVSLIWGIQDPYLNKGVVEDLAKCFTNSKIFPLPAGHWVQIERSQEVSRLMLQAA